MNDDDDLFEFTWLGPASTELPVKIWISDPLPLVIAGDLAVDLAQSFLPIGQDFGLTRRAMVARRPRCCHRRPPRGALRNRRAASVHGLRWRRVLEALVSRHWSDHPKARLPAPAPTTSPESPPRQPCAFARGKEFCGPEGRYWNPKPA
jgi:hypothetical protein